MTETEYIEEIQLIRKQNNTELELYPLASEIIAPTLKGLSKRYVFARRKSLLGQIYYGISSFPDVAILDRDFKNKENSAINIDNWKKLRGCLEVKTLDKKLYTLRELRGCIGKFEKLSKGTQSEVAQILGEILWYKKVLYTNGIQWILFSLNFPDDPDDEIRKKIRKELGEKIVEIAEERTKNDIPIEWWKKHDILDIINENVSEQVITKDCTKEWSTFTENIKKINWRT